MLKAIFLFRIPVINKAICIVIKETFASQLLMKFTLAFLMICLINFILLMIDYCSGFFETCTHQGIVRNLNGQSCAIFLPTGESYRRPSPCNFDGLAHQPSDKRKFFYWQSNLRNDIVYYNCQHGTPSLKCNQVNLTSKLKKGNFVVSYLYFLPPRDNLFMVRKEDASTLILLKENEKNFSGTIIRNYPRILLAEKYGLYRINDNETDMAALITRTITNSNSENFIDPQFTIYNL